MKEKCKGCSFQKIITVTDKEEGRVEKREKRRNEGEKGRGRAQKDGYTEVGTAGG